MFGILVCSWLCCFGEKESEVEKNPAIQQTFGDAIDVTITEDGNVVKGSFDTVDFNLKPAYEEFQGRRSDEGEEK